MCKTLSRIDPRSFEIREIFYRYNIGPSAYKKKNTIKYARTEYDQQIKINNTNIKRQIKRYLP